MSEWISTSDPVMSNDFYNPKASYEDRKKLFYLIIKEKDKESINYLEFGVADGETFNWWLQHEKNTESRFYGFDTFEGLPEDWGNFKKGVFTTGGALPEITDSRGRFIKGLFQETLFGFLKTFNNDKPAVLILDADLYSSTLFVLTTLAPYLKKGDFIFFDEFFAAQHEFLAFKNFTDSFKIKLQFIAAANNFQFTLFKVL